MCPPPRPTPPTQVRWYLDRGLADVVGEEPLTIQLRFEPRGRGHADDQYYLVGGRMLLCVCWWGASGGLVWVAVLPALWIWACRFHGSLLQHSHRPAAELSTCLACRYALPPRASAYGPAPPAPFHLLIVVLAVHGCWKENTGLMWAWPLVPCLAPNTSRKEKNILPDDFDALSTLSAVKW